MNDKVSGAMHPALFYTFLFLGVCGRGVLHPVHLR